MDRREDQGSDALLRALLRTTPAATPAQRSAPQLLDDLLTQAIAVPPPAAIPPSTVQPARRTMRFDPRLRYVLMVLVAAIALAGLYLVARTASAMISIQQNIQAMRPATPLPRATAPTREPTVALPAGFAATIVAQATLVRAQATPSGGAASATTTRLQPAAQAPADPSVVVASPTVVSNPGATATITPVPLNAQPACSGNTCPTPALAALPTLAPNSLPQRSPPPGGAITMLLLGIDRRPDEEYPSRADSIIVARIDPGQGRVALLSLPRDLIVNIPGFGYGRINAASVYGEMYPELGGGVALARQTVSQLLGIPIDYVMYIDFMGFISAIDAVGGIEIDVEKEIYDPQYPTMDYGYTVAHFLPGPQHMDGATALMYGRTRHADSDWDRARRQQQIMIGVANKLRQQTALDRVQGVAALSESLRGYITTDLPEDQMLGLAWAFRQFDPNHVERYVLDGSMVAQGVAGDPFAQYALPGTLEWLTAQLLGGE